MLRELVPAFAQDLLQLADAARLLATVRAALASTAASEPQHLLEEVGWRAQLVGAFALAVAGGDQKACTALWRAMDSGSWVSPQLAATAFLIDPAFELRAEERLLGGARRPPKLIGSLVRAYHRLPRPKMATIALLARHDVTLISEEARIGIRGVDTWLDRLGRAADPTMQQHWVRLPAPPPGSSSLS
jgi:hypothetical protein